MEAHAGVTTHELQEYNIDALDVLDEANSHVIQHDDWETSRNFGISATGGHKL